MTSNNRNGQTSTTDLPNGSSGAAPLTLNLAAALELSIKCHRIDGMQQNLSVVASKSWTPAHQNDFSCDLCDLFVSCGITWNSTSNPQLTLFCKKCIPEAEIPDQRVLAGHILKEWVADVEVQIKQKVKGNMAMGQCDGSKNVMKTPLVASMITVEYYMNTSLNTHNFITNLTLLCGWPTCCLFMM